MMMETKMVPETLESSHHLTWLQPKKILFILIQFTPCGSGMYAHDRELRLLPIIHLFNTEFIVHIHSAFIRHIAYITFHSTEISSISVVNSTHNIWCIFLYTHHNNTRTPSYQNNKLSLTI
jgi:hypothetical protein